MNLLTDGSESTEPIIEPREDSTNSLPDEVIIREWSPGDVNYIMATWLRGAHVEYNGVLPDTLWYDAHRKFIELVTSNRHCIIKIMAAAEDPATIVGYAVASNGVLLWIHMRPQFR